MFTVKYKKQVEKNYKKMPVFVQDLFIILVQDLKENGPCQPKWQNYSKLGANEYHCHLSHKWVACWRHEKNSIVIEVYYAGSREDAPY